MIGLDGVPYRLLNDLAQKGVMPNVRRIIADGFFRPLASTIPEVSSVAWSSIITGKNPGEHGIFGFTDIPPHTYRLSFPNFNSLKAEPFWHGNEGRAVIMNVPSTFPAKEMNGVHISGFVSLDLMRSVYPQSLLPQLKAMNYQIDVDSAKAHKSMQLFLKNLEQTLEARINVYQYLWEREKWQTFMLVFTGTDRLMHFLWDAYEDESHRYHADFVKHFCRIDDEIGMMLSQLKPNDSFLLMSDHGFERLDKNVYVNAVLRQAGFLCIPGDSDSNFGQLNEKTCAFSLDPARIYIHKKDKYPRGRIKKNEIEKLIQEIAAVFQSLEIDGKPVCKRIYRKEEIYSGPYSADAPDLVLIGNEGINFHSSLKATTVHDRGIFTGKHTHYDAFLLVKDWAGTDTFCHNLDVGQILDIVNYLKVGKVNIHEKEYA